MNKHDFVDFKLLKQEVPIEDLLQVYGLAVGLKKSGDQLRGTCPVHNGSNDRQFAVNLKKGTWYCFGKCQTGGDIIALVAALNQCSARDAALDIKQRFHVSHSSNGEDRQEPEKETAPLSVEDGDCELWVEQEQDEDVPQNPLLSFKRLDYLQTDHQCVIERGVLSETAEHFGAGYASRGIMRTRIAVPIHNCDGKLVAYAGLATKRAQHPPILYPKGFDPTFEIYNQHRVIESIDDGEACQLTIVRDILHVFTLFEQDIDHAVALLGDTVTERHFQNLMAFINAHDFYKVSVLIENWQDDSIKLVRSLGERIYNVSFTLAPELL